MAGSLSIDNCLIQVRSSLQGEGIKLWLEPYYVQGIGPVDLELEVSIISTHCEIMGAFFITSFIVRVLLLFTEIGIKTITNCKCSV